MRYHYRPGPISSSIYAKTYICNHPVYDRCTLYKNGKRGLAVIQQRYTAKTKATWWSNIDSWLVDEIYMNQKFKMVFEKYADEEKDGLYPTMSIRQLMWKLRCREGESAKNRRYPKRDTDDHLKWITSAYPR